MHEANAYGILRQPTCYHEIMQKCLMLFLLFIQPIAGLAEKILLNNINAYSAGKNSIEHMSSLLFDNASGLILENTIENRQNAKQIDGKNMTVIPGFIDAHGHVFSYGISQIKLQLRDINSLEKTLEAINKHSQKYPGRQWITGRGWNQALWGKTHFPNRQHLDQIVSDRPIWLVRVDGHAGWANTAALKLAGIDKKIASSNELILKDKYGEPTGILIDNAMSLITKKLPKTNTEDKVIAYQTAFKDIIAAGITSVHDAGIGIDDLKIYKEFARKNQLPLRIYAMLDGNLSQAKFEKLFHQDHININDHLILRSVKLMADGALGSYGALLHQPYSDRPNTIGEYVMPIETIENKLRLAAKYNIQANIHAIGDRANSEVIELLTQDWANTRQLRHRIEHAQILRLEDMPRMQKAHIIASMQPTHATSDMNMAEDRVGPARIKGGYAWKTLRKSGILIAFGSDFPVELFNPFYGLYAAVMRQNFKNQPSRGWYPEEKTTLENAFRNYTINAAYAAHMENKIGSLEVGKYADFIIIDRDIFKVDPNQIWRTKVLETWINGRQITYPRENLLIKQQKN